MPTIYHLLRVPIEIRNEIYRHLLLPLPSREMGLDLNDRESQFMGLSSKIRARDADDNKKPYNYYLFYGEESVVTHTSILRVCWQIYHEAASIFYSELTIIVEPGDVRLRWEVDIVWPNKRVWRHNPLKPGPHIEDNGTVHYKHSEMDGRMEPHFFARFQKVNLSMDFDWSLGEIQIVLDPDYNVHSSYAAEFTAGLQKSTFLKDFVAVLSNSPCVRHFSVSLGIDIMAYYDDEISTVGSDDDQDSDTESDTDLNSDANEDYHAELPSQSTISGSNGPSEPQNADMQDFNDIGLHEDVLTAENHSVGMADWKGMIRDAKANERAVEIFLDSGILDPLRKLSNVETFSLNFDHMFTVSFNKNYKPSTKHLNMLQSLKSTIQGNFKVKPEVAQNATL